MPRFLLLLMVVVEEEEEGKEEGEEEKPKIKLVLERKGNCGNFQNRKKHHAYFVRCLCVCIPVCSQGLLARTTSSCSLTHARLSLSFPSSRRLPKSTINLFCTSVADLTWLNRYTAAGFSGRMPMAELADAIVESGRQTLIAAARTVIALEIVGLLLMGEYMQ